MESHRNSTAISIEFPWILTRPRHSMAPSGNGLSFLGNPWFSM